MNRLTTYMRESGLARELAFFALYLILIVLGLFVGLVIWREALSYVFFVWIPMKPWVARFLYMLVVVVGSISLVAGLLMAEPYLNTGKLKGQLMRRFLRAAVPLAVAGLLGYLVLITSRAG